MLKLEHLNGNKSADRVQDIALGAGDVRFDSQVSQIGRSLAYRSPPLRRFFEVVLLRH